MDRSLALPLIRQIYEAALDPSHWNGFVQGLSDAYEGAPTGFALQLPGFPLSGVIFASTGFRDDYLERFVAHSVRGLPWEGARRRNFVGRFGLASEVISDARVRESEFYREWMEPQGLAPHGPIGHTVALDGGRPVAGIAIFRQAGRGPFAAADLEFGDLLVPHMALGYRIHAQTRRDQALADAIDRFPTGLVLLDARGHVLRSNLGADRILAQNDGLALEENSLRAAIPADDASLRRLIAASVEAAVTATRPIESNVLAIRRRTDRRPFAVMVAPLRPHTGQPTLVDAVAVLYVADLESGVLRRRQALRELYGLTEAETHLVELLCQGASLEAAADTRGVTMNTARSQLKQVFAKTHTSRQSELLRLVLSGVTSIAGP